MKIEHVAMWTVDLERMKAFYENYFDGKAGDKYINIQKRFESYFLTFFTGARLELMRRDDISGAGGDVTQEHPGLIHLAFAVGSREGVDSLTNRLQSDGYHVEDGPRRTGDGYYESCVIDPEGNRIEITV